MKMNANAILQNIGIYQSTRSNTTENLNFSNAIVRTSNLVRYKDAWNYSNAFVSKGLKKGWAHFEVINVIEPKSVKILIFTCLLSGTSGTFYNIDLQKDKRRSERGRKEYQRERENAGILPTQRGMRFMEV